MDEEERTAYRARHAQNQGKTREQMDEDELAGKRARDAERQWKWRENKKAKQAAAVLKGTPKQT